MGNDLNRAITPAEIWEAYQILDQRSECNLERARGNLPGGWTFMKRLKPNSTACDKYFWAPSVPTGKNGVKFGCEGYYNSVKNFRLAIGQPHQCWRLMRSARNTPSARRPITAPRTVGSPLL